MEVLVFVVWYDWGMVKIFPTSEKAFEIPEITVCFDRIVPKEISNSDVRELVHFKRNYPETFDTLKRFNVGFYGEDWVDLAISMWRCGFFSVSK